jgi:small subunit ribosomal protein S5
LKEKLVKEIKQDKGSRGEGGRSDKEEVTFSSNLIAVNRVAKVVKGGKRFSFAALVVVGDGRGRAGYGSGKAREVPEALKKATEQAKKSMQKIPLKEGRTLHHDVTASFGAGLVHLRAAPAGTGIIAGGPMRAVFESLGIQDVVSKSLGTSNPYNMVKATFKALCSIQTPKMVAAKRGKKVSDIFADRRVDAAEQGGPNV